KVWMPKSYVNASMTQGTQNDQTKNDGAGNSTDNHMDGSQACHNYDEEQFEQHPNATQDIPSVPATNDGNHSLESNLICSPRQCPPTLNTTDEVKEANTIDTEGFDRSGKRTEEKS
ncbi:hypothetical protein Dimus_037262, partial [Dionaea muscipula]